MRTVRAPLALAVLLAAGLAGCTGGGGGDGLRLGYFPNVTHAQALYGIQSGLYAKELGSHPFLATQFNAGPTAMEALLTGQVDAAYVGPSPVLNALAATGGGTLRIIAGAASGGARLILREGVQVDGPADLAGKTFASPQLGNTQDVSLKDWLRAQGHATKDKGGDVDVVNAANPDILTLFRTRQLDGATASSPPRCWSPPRRTSTSTRSRPARCWRRTSPPPQRCKAATPRRCKR
jgi:NitT/TauT family transport system substrate-binding protein